ncbi:MAG: tRNA preQ1(34) S-adenosylmethionine ribosyltransferase-isomerase QueA [Candidatus Sulfobium sp.]
MKTTDYDFHLPADLIAARPLEKRDSSRLLVLHRKGGMEHRTFSELPSLLNPGDMLVVNNSKVFPARLDGRKPTGGRLEVLLVSERSPGLWNILCRERYTGPLKISENLEVHVNEGRTALFSHHAALREIIRREGRMPLPPYIKRQPDEDDRERYQTVYAEVEGSIAAPTAGLHFTRSLMEALESASVAIRSVTLHVGTGTFRPVRTAELKDHKMDREFFEMTPELIPDIKRVRERGNRVVAVGTTTTRALEGYMSGRAEIVSSNGTISGSTDIFIHEGYRPAVVDALITNFHLPRSTPLMLAAVFAGREKLLAAYSTAVSMGYRFFSYGDAMLVL